MEKILHQLIDGTRKHPIIYRVSSIYQLVQDFFHPQYVEILLPVLGLKPSTKSHHGPI